MSVRKRPSWKASLPLALAATLASCNNAGTSLQDGLAAKNTASLTPPIASEAERKAAYKRVATQLDDQKRSLKKERPVVKPQPVTVARLTPAPETIKARLAPAKIPEIQKGGKSFGPLGRFHAKLAALKSGKRRKPVTILHIGDSHVASDSFTRGIRSALQATYGDAGRGMVIPAGAFKYGVADQISLKTSGNWRAETALKKRTGAFGISGVSVSSRSSRSELSLTSKTGQFDWAEVTVATGPSQGAFSMNIGKTSKRFDASSSRNGSQTFRLEASGKKLVVKPVGGARTTVLNWATGKNRPGVRYVNFGLIGATVDITKRFDKRLVANDVRRLDPDLIIYGYGTNEGFNDGLNLSRYQKFATSYVNELLASAPNADLVYLGAASGLRKNGKRQCGGWSTPPKLGPLRTQVRQMAAQQGAAYWDWSSAMGGACGINTWAGQGLAAKDRVHLTSKGYRRSAKSFANWLTRPAKSNVTVASN